MGIKTPRLSRQLDQVLVKHKDIFDNLLSISWLAYNQRELDKLYPKYALRLYVSLKALPKAQIVSITLDKEDIAQELKICWFKVCESYTKRTKRKYTNFKIQLITLSSYHLIQLFEKEFKIESITPLIEQEEEERITPPLNINFILRGIDSQPLCILSSYERELLALRIEEGLNYYQIADKLLQDEKTIRKNLKLLFVRLGT